jgi:hypothetical protein
MVSFSGDIFTVKDFSKKRVGAVSWLAAKTNKDERLIHVGPFLV